MTYSHDHILLAGFAELHGGVRPQVRIILNKSDQVDQQQLMRVYGALMWSLGKVFKSPEVCKVGWGLGFACVTDW